MAASPELEGSTMDDKHVYPLNPRRLKVVIITQIARGLGLPTNASLSETRGLIEGKLGENREPRNVQVIVIGEGVIVKLRDEGGVFAEIPADVGTTERPDRDGGEDGVYPVEEEEEVEEELTGMTSSRHRDDTYAQEELELELELEEVKKQLETTQIEVKKLMEELEKTRESYERALEVKDQVVSDLTDKVKHEKERTLWRMNCQQLADYDENMASRDEELRALRDKVAVLEGKSGGPARSSSAGVIPAHGDRTVDRGDRAVDRGAVVSVSDPGRDPVRSPFTPVRERIPELDRHLRPRDLTELHRVKPEGSRKGKAPPVDMFDGESPDVLFEDWVPALQRAAEWNKWTEKETLIQLVGHLRGRALQEWGLLASHDKGSRGSH